MLNAGDGPLSPQLLDFDEGNAEETEETVESELNQFKQAFINERASPEILDYKLHLVEDFVELVNTQVQVNAIHRRLCCMVYGAAETR
jgi:hypothetical protein